MNPADLAAVSEQLEVGRVVSAYRAGLFPMGLGDGGQGPYGWWSPRSRGVLLPGSLRVTKSLRKSMKRMHVTWNTDFESVIRACADPARPGAWISEDIIDAYCRLADGGVAKSVEVRNGDGELIGGLYGVDLGRVFAGESMFHRASDASKAALVGLVDHLDRRFEGGDWIIDTQWATPHLKSLGVSEMIEAEYANAVVSRLEVLGTQDFPM